MNIIVTGASSGIGFEIVKAFCVYKKFRIIAIARNSDRLLQLKNECIRINPNAELIIIPFDLSENDFTPLFKEIQSHIGSLNILVNNAGVLTYKEFEKTGTDELIRIFNINVYSSFKLIQGVLPLFNNPSPAHIVNIGSMGGFQGSVKFAGLSAYSASKAALASLTECLALEFQEKGISVNCLALGSVQTDMLKTAFPGYTGGFAAEEIGNYIADFSINGHKFFNGKVLPLASNTP